MPYSVPTRKSIMSLDMPKLFLLLLAVALFSAPRATAAGTVDVSGSITRNNVSLTEAVDVINLNLVAGGRYVVTVKGDQSPDNNAISPQQGASWFIGSDEFASVTIKGSGVQVLTGLAGTGVLKIRNVTDAVLVQDLKIIGGSIDSTSGSANGFGAGLAVDGAGAAASWSVSIENVQFSENSVDMFGNDGNAYGGAVMMGSFSGTSASGGRLTVTGTSFERNTASGASVYGGALFLGGGVADIDGAAFTKNQATGYQNSFGGAIYMRSGTLNLKDSTLAGNQASGGWFANNAGGAIYANTGQAEASVINLSASAGEETIIAGNLAGGAASGIHFGIGDSPASESDALLTVSGEGRVALLDPVTVEMNNGKNFSMTKSGSGTLAWGGRNVFTTDGGVVDIRIGSGNLWVSDSFTARAEGGATDYSVSIGSGVTIAFQMTRDEDTAMFDFANAGSKSFTVARGATLTTGLAREIFSRDWEFAIVSGADADNLTAAERDIKFVQEGNLPYYDLDLLVRGDTLYATVSFDSPFDHSGVNPKNAQAALERVVKHLGDRLTDAEYRAILDNPYAVTPELYMDQSIIMMNAVGSVARRAVNFGSRQPHHMRLRVTGKPAAARQSYESSGGYEDGYEDAGYYDGYRAYDAYPSLASCDRENGFRIWAGYIGDFDRRNDHGGYQGFDVDRNGILIGVNYDVGLRGSIGAYGGYTRSEASSRLSHQKNTADAGHFGLTGRFSPLIDSPEFSIYVDGGYHFADNEYSRRTGSFEARNSYDQDVLTAGLGLEYLHTTKSGAVAPYVEGRFTRVRQDALKETGNSVTAAHIDSMHESYFHTRLGVEFSHDFQLACGMISPSLNVAWRHEFGDRHNTARAVYVNDPASGHFFVNSSGMEKDSADIGVAVKSLHLFGSRTRLAFNLAYNLNVSRNTTNHALYAGVDVGF